MPHNEINMTRSNLHINTSKRYYYEYFFCIIIIIIIIIVIIIIIIVIICIIFIIIIVIIIIIIIIVVVVVVVIITIIRVLLGCPVEEAGPVDLQVDVYRQGQCGTGGGSWVGVIRCQTRTGRRL